MTRECERNNGNTKKSISVTVKWEGLTKKRKSQNPEQEKIIVSIIIAVISQVIATLIIMLISYCFFGC